MTCPNCGETLRIGEWPFCPHGALSGAFSIETNESFIGGLTLENMGEHPVTVYSREEYRREMSARGLTQRIKHVPGDKYLVNWAAGPDAKTLENAAILVGRAAERAEEKVTWTRVPEFTIRTLTDAEAAPLSKKVQE